MSQNIICYQINSNDTSFVDTVLELPINHQHVSLKNVQSPIREQNLQEFLVQNFYKVFNDLGYNLHLIDSEKTLGDTKNRIDILAIDSDGRLVVIELKRGNNSVELLTQAMGYAGILSQFGKGKEAFCKLPKAKQQDVKTFLDSNGTTIEQFNHAQKVLLIAEGFSIKTRGAITWLNQLNDSINITEEYINAVTVSLHEKADCRYLTFENVDLDLEDIQGKITDTNIDESPSSKDDAVASIKNKAAQDFIQNYIDGNDSEWYPDNKHIYIRKDRRSSRTWRLHICANHIRVRQNASHRFQGDVAYWRSKIDSQIVTETSKGLTFILKTSNDFIEFEKARQEKHQWC